MNNLKNNNIKDLLKQYNDLVKEKQEIQAAIDKIQRELDKMEAEGYTEKDSVTGGNGGKQHFEVEGFPYPAYSRKRTLLLVRQRQQIDIKEKIDTQINLIEQCINQIDNTDYARVVEKKMKIEVDGVLVDVLDEDGNPIMYRTVEPVLTEELTDDQKRALAVIKKGRDGLEVRPCSKEKALELLGRHLGMFTDKIEANINDSVKNELAELLAQRKARGEPDASK